MSDDYDADYDVTEDSEDSTSDDTTHEFLESGDEAECDEDGECVNCSSKVDLCVGPDGEWYCADCSEDQNIYNHDWTGGRVTMISHVFPINLSIHPLGA